MISLLLSLLVGTSTHALTVEQIQKLSKASRWGDLLHYKASLWEADKSIVRSPEFFLSPNGATHPDEELQATLSAMSAPATGDRNQHAQCRFPARALWLKQVAPLEANQWPKVECPNYAAFAYGGEIESISLVFATGYLSNPASYFGHPLIKFNLSRAKIPTSLLDVSVNYGALTPDNENPFVYMVRGLFGGYKATFSHRHFYYSNHTYGEIDLRDMWEYKLNLKPEEVQFFYAHTWELLGMKFPYYFFSENCASAAAEIVEDATGVALMPRFLPYAIPYTLFDNLMKKKRLDGEPLVTSVAMIPSRQTRLTDRFRELDPEQKKAVESVARTNHTTDQLSSLPPDRRVGAVETLFDYYSFRSAKSPEKNFAEVKRELLVSRLQLPPGVQSSVTQSSAKPPHAGPRPLLTRLGGVDSSKYGRGFEFQFRTSYYDLLSLDLGRPSNSEVRTLDVSLDFIDDDLWIRKVDLISVSTLNLSTTGLPGDGGWAWEFVTGFDSLNLGCRSCTLFKVEAGYGKAFLAFERQVFYVMVNARAHTEVEDSGYISATPRAGVLINWLPSGAIASEVSIGYRHQLERDQDNAAVIKAETRIGLSRLWDIRLTYDKHVEELSRVSGSFYW